MDANIVNPVDHFEVKGHNAVTVAVTSDSNELTAICMAMSARKAAYVAYHNVNGMKREVKRHGC